MKHHLYPQALRIAIVFCLSCLMLVSSPLNVLADELYLDLKGAELQFKIAEEYSPEQTLGYRQGRDVLYTQIDNQDGVVTGIYTGYSANIRTLAKIFCGMIIGYFYFNFYLLK